MYVDFHTHTLASDGKLTPKQLVKKAKSFGFSYLAKTDHDTLDLTKEFLTAGKKYKIHTISGIEISSRYKNKSLHIAGLNIDPQNKAILKFSLEAKQARKKRGLDGIKALSRAGWKINKKEIDKDLICRPHLALAVIKHKDNHIRLMKEFGKIPNFFEFITSYLTPGKIGFIKKEFYLKPTDALKLIHNAGGLAIISHPSSKTKEFSYTQSHLLELIKKFNFDGIEAYNHDATAKEVKQLLTIAKKHHLLVSAGSDYHGHDDELYPLGSCNNSKRVKTSACKELIFELNL